MAAEAAPEKRRPSVSAEPSVKRKDEASGIKTIFQKTRTRIPSIYNKAGPKGMCSMVNRSKYHSDSPAELACARVPCIMVRVFDPWACVARFE